MTEDTANLLAEAIKRKKMAAERSRQTAQKMSVALFISGATAVILLLSTFWVRWVVLDVSILWLVGETTKGIEEQIKGLTAVGVSPSDAVDLLKARPAGSGSDGIANVLQTAVISFGLVGLAIWLVQIALSFIRYHQRLSNVFDAQADAILLSQGDSAKLKAYSTLLSPEIVTFGEVPTTLQEKIVDALKEVVSKRMP